jgi:hypothetical protein
MQRRQFLRLVGGGSVAAATVGGLAGCGAAVPPEAVAAWAGPGEQSDLRRWVLSWALLAPHSHNLQSWIADLRTPERITLYCDRTRLLPETDPLSRQILMSQGTFLELLAIAAAERGHRAEITLFPEGVFGPDKVDDRPVAQIRLVPEPGLARDPLFAQIPRRHTNREAYDAARPVPASAWGQMAESVRGWAGSFGHTGGADDATLLPQHRAIASEAWRIELTTTRTIMESYRVLRVGSAEIAKHRDGISLTDPMVVALTKLGLFDRSQAPAPGDKAVEGQIEDFDAKIASTPAFLWMTSQANDRPAQVAAGRAYARVQLAATAAGVVMQPLSQALQEYAEVKGPYDRIHKMLAPSGGTVQMWARVGFGPAIGPAPRRGLDAIIRA